MNTSVVKEYIRLAFSFPPHVLVKKAYGRLRRSVKTENRRRDDFKKGTYSPIGDFKGARLESYFPALSADALAPHARNIAVLARLYMEHRFDLLGSGWVQVRHGMKCAGIEGMRHDFGKPVRPDLAGNWLRGVINPGNVAESRRLWSLIGPGYEPVDWQLDFKSGFRWSGKTWYKDISYYNVPGNDIKMTWDMSRVQHLPLLAMAHRLAASGAQGFAPAGDYAREFRATALDFMACCPPRFGANWACTMDVAIRAANLLAAYDMFTSAGAAFDRDFTDAFVRCIYDHGVYIAGNLEYDPRVRGNHYLADISGLLFVAAYLPRSDDAGLWLAYAVSEIVREAALQFQPDGSTIEASTMYHCLCAEMLTYSAALAHAVIKTRKDALTRFTVDDMRKIRPDFEPVALDFRVLPDSNIETCFPPEFFARLEKTAEFIMHASKPGGRLPQIGDNDSGRFFKLQPAHTLVSTHEAINKYESLRGNGNLPETPEYPDEDHLDRRCTAAAINGFFGRTDIAEFAGADKYESAIIRSLSGGATASSYIAPGGVPAARGKGVGGPADFVAEIARLENLPREQKSTVNIHLPGKSLRRGLEVFSYLDFGIFIFKSERLYLAARAGSIGFNGAGIHAHNDQLHIELTADGKDILRDPGTYVYTALPHRRNEYRSVKSHFAPRPAADAEPGSFDIGLFRLGDEAQGRCICFGPEGFLGTHRGFGYPVYRSVIIQDEAVVISDYFTEAPAGGIGAPASGAPPHSPGYGIKETRN